MIEEERTILGVGVLLVEVIALGLLVGAVAGHVVLGAATMAGSLLLVRALAGYVLLRAAVVARPLVPTTAARGAITTKVANCWIDRQHVSIR